MCFHTLSTLTQPFLWILTMSMYVSIMTLTCREHLDQWWIIKYTPWAIKRSQPDFVCNLVKNQWILTRQGGRDSHLYTCHSFLNLTLILEEVTDKSKLGPFFMMHTSSLSLRLNAYGYLIQNLTMERIYHFLALPLCGTAHVKFIALWLI